MQHNNNNVSIANELETIAGQISALDKVDIQKTIEGIQQAHIEIENISQKYEIPTLRTIIHWVSLNAEINEENEIQISSLLNKGSFSNWIDVLANILRENELSLLPSLHQNLTSPDWLVAPSAPLLKEVAEWVSEIRTANDSDHTTEITKEATTKSIPNSIDDLINVEVDKAIQANNDLLIQKNAFEEIGTSELNEDYSKIDELIDVLEGDIPLIEIEDLVIDEEASNVNKMDIDLLEINTENDTLMEDNLFAENDQLLDTMISESENSGSSSEIDNQSEVDIELNDIILKLKSININPNDVFASKNSYLKQLEHLSLLTSNSSYQPITPIIEWCQQNLDLFEKNPDKDISVFIYSGEVWSWIEQLQDCLNNNNKEKCIKNLSTALTKKEWLEPIDTDVLQTLLYWVNSKVRLDDNVVPIESARKNNNLEQPELISFEDIVIDDVLNEGANQGKNITPAKTSGFKVNWADDTHPELLMVYLEETPGQISELIQILKSISSKTADTEDKQLAARLAHTIKGGSAIVGITALSEFTYRLETLLDYSTKHSLSSELLAQLPEAANCLESLFEAVQLQLDEPAEFYPLFQKLDIQVNNLDSDEDDIELATPDLPVFINDQNDESEVQSIENESTEFEVSAKEENTNEVDTNEEENDEEKAVESVIAENSVITENKDKSPFELNWDDDIHPELLMVYLEETPEQINVLVPLMQKISKGLADEEEKHIATRMAHTIKGASALVGITALSEFSYCLETLLDYSVNQTLSDEILVVLPEAATCLDTLFSAVQLQEDEPEEFYPLFLQLDNFVNNLEEVDESLELSEPELPDFIKEQNTTETVIEATDESESIEDNEITSEASDSNEDDKLITEEVASLDKLNSDDDLKNITKEIDDIVMSLVSISSNAQDIKSNLDEYSIELQRFDLIADISGYPELSLLSQWCQANLVLLAKNKSDKDQAFVSSASIWKWIEFVGAALSEPDDMSHMSALSAELMRDEWPQAIEMQDIQTVLLALRHLENNESETSKNEVNPDSATNDDSEVISWDADVHPELLAVYFNETPDQINTVAQLLNKIAKGKSNTEDHKKAARIAHTIKGASGVVGLNSLVDLTHNLEDILDYAINNEIPTETTELLAESSDCLEDLFESIQERRTEPEEFKSVLERLIEFSGSIDRERITPDYMLDNQESSKPVETEETTDSTSVAASNVKAAPIDTLNSKVLTNEAHLRVPVSVINKLLNLAGELVTTSSQVSDKLNNALHTNKTIKTQDQRVHRSLDELNRTISRQEKEQKTMFSSLENSDFDALEMDSYNELHSVASLLSETIIDGQELDNSLTKQLTELNEKLRSLDKLNKDFSDVILSSRMVSIDTIVSRLERIVRQTCRKTGKQAELVVTGNNINIDTDILNGLVDPLLHMLRNSIDHGIETPEQRRKKNKDEKGLIELSFERDGNNILMSLKDDGAGIDPEVIYQKAVHKDFITPDQEFSKSDTLKLILTPGFSTQENVSDISGRGVGMDVVNTSVEDLNGSLDIDSELGEGTNFKLTIPLTLITNTTLMVKAAGNIVAVPTDTIEQILYQEVNSVISRDNSYFVNYEDQELEIHSLSQLLGWSNHGIDFSQSFSVLVIKSNNESYAIHIDSILSSREVVVKSLNPYIAADKGVIGACHLNDGGVAPVINLVAVINQQLSSATKKSAKSVIESAEVETTSQILVVDDSLSNRKALSLIIDKTDYDVLTAVDGMDALQIINENQIDLVFTDLEMPRMNGLELTQAIRAWKDKSKTPIVMITSRTTNKHRELATKAGVDDYLTKPVVTETLLESINTWLAKKESVEA